MKRATVGLGSVAVISLVAVATLVVMNTFPPGEIEDIFAENDVWIASEAMTVALLFNRSFRVDSIRLAGTTVDMTKIPEEVAKYLAANPYAAENLFSEVLYDAVNRQGSVPEDELFPMMSGGTINLATTRLGLDAGMFTLSYGGRSWGIMQGAGVEYGTLGESQTTYEVSTILTASPIVLDMDGNGLLQASDGNWLPHPQHWSMNLDLFDINSDGLKEIMEWVGPEDGLLISTMPTNDTELTGASLFGDTDGWSTGYAKLRQYDLNNDSVLEGSELDGLYVWQDKSQDAVTSPGEVSTLGSLGITSISLSHHRLKSTFKIGTVTQTLWDWYPNALVVLRVGDGQTPIVECGPVVQTMPMLQTVTVGQGFVIGTSEIASLGLGNARIQYVTDAGLAVLVQRLDGFDLESEGYHYRLVMLHSDDGVDVTMRSIPLNVSEVLTVTPIGTTDGAVVIADAGSRILGVNFATGDLETLYDNCPGKPGFRAGADAHVDGGILYNWGAFYTADGVLSREGMMTIPLTGGNITPVIDVANLTAQIPAQALGGSAVSSEGVFFVGMTDEVTIMTADQGILKEIDAGERFGGLWGAESSLLYLLRRPESNGFEVLLYKASTGNITLIATGNYSFPVLSYDGSALLVARYDFPNRRMSYYYGVEEDQFELHPLLQDVAIGPIRLSENGGFYAHQSLTGIIVGQIATPT